MRMDFKPRAVIGALSAGAIVAAAALTLPGGPTAQGQQPTATNTVVNTPTSTSTVATITATVTTTPATNTPSPTITNTVVVTNTSVPSTNVPSTATRTPTAVVAPVQPPQTGDGGLSK